MNSSFQDRRNVVALITGGLAIAWFAIGRRNPDTAAALHVPEVDVARAQAMLAAGALALDVRGQSQFASRHLPNAVLLPLDLLQAGPIPAWLAAKKDLPVLVYCGDGVAHGPEATRLLRDAGFAQAVNLAKGIDGWADAGLPVQRG